MFKLFFIAFFLLCSLGCVQDELSLRYYTQGTNLQISDVENKTFSKYENNIFIEKWKFNSDAIATPTVSILYAIQGNVFILGNGYLKTIIHTKQQIVKEV